MTDKKMRTVGDEAAAMVDVFNLLRDFNDTQRERILEMVDAWCVERDNKEPGE